MVERDQARWRVTAVVRAASDADAESVGSELAASLRECTTRVEGRRVWLTFTVSDPTVVGSLLPGDAEDRQFFVRLATRNGPRA